MTTIPFVRGIARGYVLAVLALLGCCFELMARAGEKIEFSTAGSATNSSGNTSSAASDFNRLNPTPNAFKQMQDDLLHPIKSEQSPVDSMQGVMTLPKPGRQQQQQTTPAAAARAKRARDKKKNWAFANMNDLESNSDSADSGENAAWSSSDSKEKSETTVIEEFVFGAADSAATNSQAQAQRVQWSEVMKQGHSSKGDSFADSTSFGSRTASGTGATDNSLLSDNRTGTSSSLGSGSSARDRFAAPSMTFDKDSLQKHRDSFRSVLDGNSGSSANGGFPRTSALNGNGGFGNSFGNSAASRPSSFASGSGFGATLGGSTRSSLFENSTPGSLSSPGFNNQNRSALTQPAPTPNQNNSFQSPFEAVSKRSRF